MSLHAPAYDPAFGVGLQTLAAIQPVNSMELASSLLFIKLQVQPGRLAHSIPDDRKQLVSGRQESSCTSANDAVRLILGFTWSAMPFEQHCMSSVGI